MYKKSNIEVTKKDGKILIHYFNFREYSEIYLGYKNTIAIKFNSSSNMGCFTNLYYNDIKVTSIDNDIYELFCLNYDEKDNNRIEK